MPCEMEFSVKNKKLQKLNSFICPQIFYWIGFPYGFISVSVLKGVKSPSTLFIPFFLKEIDKTLCTSLFPKDVCRTFFPLSIIKLVHEKIFSENETHPKPIFQIYSERQLWIKKKTTNFFLKKTWLPQGEINVYQWTPRWTSWGVAQLQHNWFVIWSQYWASLPVLQCPEDLWSSFGILCSF